LNPLSYFDIQVINLPSRADRREDFGRELAAAGMSYADVRLFSAVRPDDANGFPSIGTLGCFLSHLGALRAAEPGRPVLICEDDLNFSRDFLPRIGTIVERLRRDEWGVFYGGHDTFGEPVRDMEPFPSDKGIRFAHMIGFNADVVLWSADPFSIYSRPDLVLIDGAVAFDRTAPPGRAASDFEVGRRPMAPQ